MTPYIHTGLAAIGFFIMTSITAYIVHELNEQRINHNTLPYRYVNIWTGLMCFMGFWQLPMIDDSYQVAYFMSVCGFYLVSYYIGTIFSLRILPSEETLINYLRIYVGFITLTVISLSISYGYVNHQLWSL